MELPYLFSPCSYASYTKLYTVHIYKANSFFLWNAKYK